MKSFTQLRVEKELRKMSDEELLYALHEAKQEAMDCDVEDEEEWKLIRETALAVGEELKRRGI